MKERVALAVALVVAIVSLGLSIRAQQVAKQPLPDVIQLRQSRVEAQVMVTQIAWGVALCAREKGELPETSRVVARLPSVRGTLYQSTPEDWSDPAFACAGVRMTRPQHYSYQWKRTDPRAGVVRAEADLDGDGRADDLVELRVRCEGDGGPLECRPEPMPTEP